VIGKRVEMQGHFGSVRYLGKLTGNPKAGDDLWLGIEWDEEGRAKHNGTVDGKTYFNCEFHVNSPNYATGKTNCCSFIRYGKIQIGGQSLSEAVMRKYQPESLMTDQELEMNRKKEQAENFIQTQKGRAKQIEVLGQDMAYQWRADVQTIRDVSLDCMRISSLGEKDTIRDCIPGAMALYLAKNLLYSWD